MLHAVINFIRETREWWSFLKDYWWISYGQAVAIALVFIMLFFGECKVFSLRKKIRHEKTGRNET